MPVAIGRLEVIERTLPRFQLCVAGNGGGALRFYAGAVAGEGIAAHRFRNSRKEKSHRVFDPAGVDQRKFEKHELEDFMCGAIAVDCPTLPDQVMAGFEVEVFREKFEEGFCF